MKIAVAAGKNSQAIADALIKHGKHISAVSQTISEIPNAVRAADLLLLYHNMEGDLRKPLELAFMQNPHLQVVLLEGNVPLTQEERSRYFGLGVFTFFAGKVNANLLPLLDRPRTREEAASELGIAVEGGEIDLDDGGLPPSGKRRFVVAVAGGAGESLANGLRRSGYTVSSVVDTLDGIAATLKDGDDLLVHRGLQGTKTIRQTVWELKRERPQLRVVVLEGKTADPAVRAELFAVGIYDWFAGRVPSPEFFEMLDHPRTAAEVIQLLPNAPEGAPEEVGLTRSPALPAADMAGSPSVRTIDRVERVIVEQPSVTSIMKPMVVFYSPAGGAGKSVIAAGFALSLAARGLSPVLLETDEDKPSQARLFGFARPDRGVDTLSRDVLLDPVGLQSTLEELYLRREGIHILPSTGSVDGIQLDADDPHLPRELYGLYDALMSRFHPLIVDLPVSIRNGIVVQTLRRASTVVLVIPPYDPAIDAVYEYLSLAQSLGIESRKHLLVANQIEDGTAVSRMEKMLGMSMAVSIERVPGGVNSWKDLQRLQRYGMLDVLAEQIMRTVGGRPAALPAKTKSKKKGKKGGNPLQFVPFLRRFAR